ncbi:Rootletin, partial [Ophiophagus hannah]
MLREQLEQANVANQALSEDIRKLTMDWTKAREELQQREAEWRREEESFNDYFSSEHSRLLTLWRQVVSLRRHFSETKSMTERDLSELKSELSHTGRAVNATCLNLSGRLHLSESTASAAVEKQALLTAQLEDKVRDVIQLQVRCDTEKEASRAQEQAVEVEALRREAEKLHQALREIAQAVILDAEGTSHLSPSDPKTDVSASNGTSLRGLSSPLRSSSPRRSLSPVFAASSLAMVQSALQKRQLQLQELGGKYEATQDLVSSLKRQLAEESHDRQSLDETVLQLRTDLANVHKQRETEVSRLERDKELLAQNRALAEQEAQAARRNMQAAQAEVERLQRQKNTASALNAELRNLRSQLEEAIAGHKREAKSLQGQARDLAKQRESALCEVEELKTRLQLLEDARELIRRELGEAHRKVREAQEACDHQRKEAADLRRGLNDESKEKEAFQRSNTELRMALKRAESERISLKRATEEKDQKISVLEEAQAAAGKEATDMRSNLQEVEQSRLEARRELQELRRQVKMLDSENSKKNKEVAELQARVALDEQREEESRRESFGLKQKIVESEAGRESARKEDDARSQLGSLKCQLAETEAQRDLASSRVQQLQKQVAACEEERRSLDGKLTGAQTALMLQEETLRWSERERKAQAEKLAALEHDLQAAASEQRATQEKLGKMKANETKLEVDKRRLRDSLGTSESRSTKLELLRRSLEGELQRAKVVLSDREAELQLLQERVTLMQRQATPNPLDGRARRGAFGCPAASQPYFGSFPPHQVTESEARASALQHSLDQLNLLLAKAADSETSLKEKVQGLTATSRPRRSCCSCRRPWQPARTSRESYRWVCFGQKGRAPSGSASLRQRWPAALPRETSPHPSTLYPLQERLDAAHKALLEAKKQNGALSERLQALKGQQAQLELQKEELEGLGRQQEEVSRLNPQRCPWLSSSWGRAGGPGGTRRLLGVAKELVLFPGSVGRGESRLETHPHRPSSPHLQLLRQRQEGEAAALRKLQKVQEDRRLLQERLGSLQKVLAQLESEKREAERLSLRLEKEKGALRRTLDKVEREKLKTHEDSVRLSVEKGRLDRSLTGTEQELMGAQEQIRQLELEQPRGKKPLGKAAAAQRQEGERLSGALRPGAKGLEEQKASRWSEQLRCFSDPSWIRRRIRPP